MVPESHLRQPIYAAKPTPNTTALPGWILGGTEQYHEFGALAGSFSPFNSSSFLSLSLAPANQSLPIDALIVELLPGSGVTSINLDNIGVATVPEPGSVVVLSVGFAGFIGWRKMGRSRRLGA